MTRKYTALFCFTAIFLFTLSVGIFGQRGYLRNSGMKKQLERNLREEELLRLQVSSLERRKASADSVDELRDVALRLGYNQEGDQVFYFSDGRQDADTVEKSSNEDSAPITVFPGVPAWILALASLGGAGIIVSLMRLARRIRIRRLRKIGDDRGGMYEF